MTHGECLAIVTGLVAAYPRELSESTLEVYVEDLRDCEPEALMRAVVQLRRTSKWLPTIAEIRAAVVDADTRFVSAAEAWHQAVQLMARRGTYRPPPSCESDPMRRALALCGRWEDVCQEDMTWLRKRYVEIYEGLMIEARHGLASGTPPWWLEDQRDPPPLALPPGDSRG